MTSKVDKIVKTYKSLAQVPTLIGANIRSNGIVSTSWSQRNLERGKTTKFTKDIFMSSLTKLTEGMPMDISSDSNFSIYENLWDFVVNFRVLSRNSASEKFRAVLRENDSKQYLEIWQDNNILRTVDVVASDIHGPVYSDAEKKSPKSEPFYKRKGPSSNEGANGDEEKQKARSTCSYKTGVNNLWVKKKSVLVEYNIESDTLEVLKGVPDDISVAQPKYSPDGTYIVGVAYETEPRKLGVIYCSNRLSTVFKLDFEGNFLKLPLNGQAVKSPIFSPDGQFILWLQRRVGGPHVSGMSLVKTSLPLTENVKNGEIIELSFEDGSQQIVDVHKDIVLAVQRNFFSQDKVVMGKLPESGSEASISWNEVTTSTTIPGLENSTYVYLDLSSKGEEGDSVRSFNAIYIGPKNGNSKSVPLIVWPHGGPHSAFSNNFIMEASVFLSFGYAVILVNYRGSSGSGQKSIDFLLGKIGKADVADCILATDTALETFPWLNPHSVALVGGSHGGFLVTHLSGQYPDKFKAVVARNPVIDVASMSIISDIPDWCYVEAGMEYTQKGEINNDILLAMRKASPIVHAHKVKAPNAFADRMNLYDDNHPLATVTNEIDNIINTLLWIEEHLGIVH
ncbi:hypothetical protein NQ314_020115 [Rhamnusium bicolor]|uniref:Acylamino-acid-releasing enzyme n=1 Tax=Rhamnusium bicolor TaxID=1586634 RepID=A0AAV8WL02_9CUCU|nr:hypothetical protein NQ314_020115 [Rhamnusium bicolor]